MTTTNGYSAPQQSYPEIVVMNADGSSGVTTSAQIGASLPSSTVLWILIAVIGLLIMIGGSAAIVVGVRQGKTSG